VVGKKGEYKFVSDLKTGKAGVGTAGSGRGVSRGMRERYGMVRGKYWYRVRNGAVFVGECEKSIVR
jgi:hypothetical protein